jgi:predicted kinase
LTALVLTVAAPGAGKSTWVREHFAPSQRVSLDHYRWMVCGDQADQSATPRAVRIMHEVLAERMARRLLTVVDAMNATEGVREAVAHHAIGWCIPAVAVVLHTPLDVCLARQRARARPGRRWPNGRAVPEHVVRERHAQIVADLPTMRGAGIWVVAHLGAAGGSFRTGQVPPDLRPVLPWLAELREEWRYKR